MDVVVFDIDGTLADTGHRLHFIQQKPKNWTAFYDAAGDDTPIHHMCLIASALISAGHWVLFATGREERIRGLTGDWLRKYVHTRVDSLFTPLYMRKEGDYRPDDIVKAEMLTKIRADGFNPILVFEDRTRVVKMWRALGIPCAQVVSEEDGDF